jgi:hypothetical protein
MTPLMKSNFDRRIFSPTGRGPPSNQIHAEMSVSGRDSQSETSAFVPSKQPDSVAQYLTSVDEAVRRGFVRKVYGILSVQLAITFGLIFLAVFFGPVTRLMCGVAEGARTAPSPH